VFGVTFPYPTADAVVNIVDAGLQSLPTRQIKMPFSYN
jgi:hypothetical protein